MADTILSKCGMRCDLCLLYRPNVEREDRRAEICEVFFKIYGKRNDPKEVTCDGCLTRGTCKVRECVLDKGHEHCGYCSEYPCDIFPAGRSQEETARNIDELHKWTWEDEKLLDAYRCRKYMDEFRKEHGIV